MAIGTPQGWVQAAKATNPSLSTTGPGMPDGGAAQKAAEQAAKNKAKYEKNVAAARNKAQKSANSAAKSRAANTKPVHHKKSKLDKYLAGDSTYQQQLAEFNASQNAYNSQYKIQKSQTNRDYNNTKRQMSIQGQRDRMDQQEDFGGRGILHSGVFAKALSDYNTDYNTQMANLVTGLNDKLGDLGTQRKTFLDQLGLQKNSARQDAIRRRAEKLGI